MTNEQSEIPLVMSDELSLGTATSFMDAGPVSKTSLESERFGLLADHAKPLEEDRRMEEWIASNLDLGDDAPPVPRSPWIRLIDGLPGMKRARQRKPPPKRGRDFDARLVEISCGVQARGDRGPADRQKPCQGGSCPRAGLRSPGPDRGWQSPCRSQLPGRRKVGELGDCRGSKRPAGCASRPTAAH